MNLRKILVPIDFSSCSWAAIDCAATLAVGCSASVDVLHVLSPPTPFADAGQAMFGAERDALVDFARAVSQDVMRDYLSVLERRAIPAGVRLEVGDAAREIVRHVDEGHYDLLVMGTHGRGVAHETRRGTAEKVARRAVCPVLTVRAPRSRATRPWSEPCGAVAKEPPMSKRRQTISTRPRAPFLVDLRVGRTDSGDAFLPDPQGGPSRVPDDFAEILAEDFLASATAAQQMTGSSDDPAELELSGLVGVAGE